ncbi:MAG TPA: nucleotidyl transferase AbiEii/AbiGii toxin family protein, partial [Ignavibacteriaceae bacterium]|nr:nucleotidyl transferase AbiEii/AbiGii toxin family protein [Ignavibacteriaceae bacterium]
KQAELLLRILPSIMQEEVFALKGGTAINFFWRDYPRLSVDIDLAYIKVQGRDLSLLEINDRLASIKVSLGRIFPGINIVLKKGQSNGLAYALKWKLFNLDKMKSEAHKKAYNKLEKYLSG